MDLGLKNKVALIGGGSRGLGKGCALQLAQAGVNVAICARDPKTLQAASAFIKKQTGSQVLPIAADLSQAAEVRRVVDTTLNNFGRIDILVANSGGPPPGRFFDLNQGDWQNAFNSVLYYVIELYRAVIPGMKKQKWGRIINITSLAVKEPAETLTLSNVFRSGVVSLAKTLSRELIEFNITINNICPGAFKTDRAIQLMEDRSKKTGQSVEEIEAAAVKNLPLGRYQRPQELGDLVAWLASELAQGITGTTIQIDGGIARGLL